MSLKTKLTLLFVSVTLVSLVLFGAAVFSQAEKTLQAVRFAQLNNIADLKKDKIETFFNERKADLKSTQSFRNIKRNLPLLIRLQQQRNDPKYLQALNELDDQLKPFQTAYGYLDVMLTDRQGRIVYVTSDTHHGEYIGHLLPDSQVVAEEGKKDIYFSNVFLNKKQGNTFEMFGIVPLKDLHGKFIGEAVIEIDMGPIYKFIQDSTGLGKTGEALIARKEGNEVLFLSPLRHAPDAALKRMVNFRDKLARPAQKAVMGETGSGINDDYGGTEVLAAWRYVPSLRWGLVTKIDAVEAFAPVSRLKNVVILVGAFMVLIGAFAALLISRTITRPLLRLQKGAEAIAAGDLKHRVEIVSRDEIGRLSSSFNTMTEKLRGSYDSLEKESEAREKVGREMQRVASFLEETQAIAHVGGWEVDLEKNTLYWTEETYRIHETSPSEYTPTVETAIAFYAPESVPVISAAVRDAIELGKEFHLELQLVTAKGRLIWVEAVGKAILRDGRTIKVLGAFQDITERKRAEALRQSNAYNRSLLEASLDPLVTIAPDGKITDVNTATENVTGRNREELIGTDFSDYFTDPDKARAGYQRVFREGSVMDYALEIRRRDGHHTPVLYNAAVYRNESGSVVGVFAAARDITDRKRAEDAVRRANAYNRSLLEASLDPLVTIAPDGKITDVNTATENVTGRNREELIGTDFADYFTDPDKARAGYERVFREGSVMDYALEIRHGDGHLTPVLYNAAVYRDDSGTVIGVFAAARDVTERKKAEEEIIKLNRGLEARVVERTAELENSNKELEAFAYSVSHDLRTPLRSIEGFSLALLEDYADRLDDTGKGYLDRVRNATVRMGQLIDDLLKLSRVTRSEMKRERVELGGIVKGIAERLTQNAPERKAQFIIDESLTAYGDEHLLTVALDNLLSNAWKFSEKASPSVIEFGVARQDGNSTYFVRDNGAGFDMAYAGKLFSPFQRLHKIEEFPGTGIGLATVRRIINRHGGKVWIESEVNKGTTVYFTL
jgi:PAS domain S-box-containing protein